MEKLAVLASSYVGGKVMKNFNVPRLIQVLMGNIPSSAKEASVAQLFLDFTSNASTSDAVLEVAFDALRGRGIEENELFTLIGSIAPMLGVDPPQSREQLLNVARLICRRVVAKKAESTISHQATIVCPNCSYVHAIEGP